MVFKVVVSLLAALAIISVSGQQNPYGGGSAAVGGGYSASGSAPPAAPAPAQAGAYPAEAPPPAKAPPPPAPAVNPAPAPSAPVKSPVQTVYEGGVQGGGQGQEQQPPTSKTHGTSNLGFPLPSCYINKDGFMCCNKELENLMDNTYRNLSQSRGGKWKKCNIHQVAVATQRNAEKHFGVDFELVVGAGDYASKNYFNQDLICKIKRDNSIILAFATPN